MNVVLQCYIPAQYKLLQIVSPNLNLHKYSERSATCIMSSSYIATSPLTLYARALFCLTLLELGLRPCIYLQLDLQSITNLALCDNSDANTIELKSTLTFDVG